MRGRAPTLALAFASARPQVMVPKRDIIKGEGNPGTAWLREVPMGLRPPAPRVPQPQGADPGGLRPSAPARGGKEENKAS